MACPQCQHAEPADARSSATTAARSSRSACPACGHGNAPAAGSATSAATLLTAQAGPAAGRRPPSTRRRISPLESSPRASALEGERKQVTVLFADIKGSMELLADRDPEEARTAARSRPRTHDGGGPSLRGHRQPGHGRRDHGALRRAARPRGPRAARLLRGAADAGAGRPATATSCSARTACRCRSASGSTRATSSCARSAAISTWTTPPWARPRISPPAWSRWPSPGSILFTAAHAAARRGLRARAARSGPVADQGTQPSRSRSSSCSAPAASRTRLQVAAGRGLTRFVGRDAELDQLRVALEHASAAAGR